jgi:hypothetical protein
VDAATTRFHSNDAAGEHGQSFTIAGFVFLTLFFVSGFAALLYQIVWQRMLTLAVRCRSATAMRCSSTLVLAPRRPPSSTSCAASAAVSS